MAAGLRREAGAAAAASVRTADGRAAAPAVARSRRHRSAAGRPRRRARAFADSSASAPPRCSVPTTGCSPAASPSFRGTDSRRAAPPTASSCSRRAARIIGRYDKAHLVPYGEYLPMRPLLSAIGLSRLAPGDLDFTSGPGPRTVDLGGEWGKVGFQLCYEIIFSGEVVDEKNRPGFIFNPVQRRLVRALGSAAASRPGTASRGGGRHSGDPRHADRHQRSDRRPRQYREVAAVADRGRHRRRASRLPLIRRRPSRGLAMSSRSFWDSCSSSAALSWAAAAARGDI